MCVLFQALTVAPKPVIGPDAEAATDHATTVATATAPKAALRLTGEVVRDPAARRKRVTFLGQSVIASPTNCTCQRNRDYSVGFELLICLRRWSRNSSSQSRFASALPRAVYSVAHRADELSRRRVAKSAPGNRDDVAFTT